MSDILIVDDERDIRELISDILKDEGFTTRLAANSDECMAEINAEAPALMILDIWLKDSRMDGIDILKTVKRDNPDVPIIIISGHGNIEIAVAAIKQGAYDFIEKPFNIDQLTVVISRAMETSRLRRENASLRRRDVSSSEMIGTSPAFRTLKGQLDKVTKSNGRVMLTGQPGSGKEVAARYIHVNSNRASGPFVTVSSASIEPERMEEVLFGRETPERGFEKGLLEQAHGGVVYFDEVADMPLGTQSKILRVLTEQQFTRGRRRRQGARRPPRRSPPPPATCRPRSPRGASGRSSIDRLNVVPDRGALARGSSRGHPRAVAPFHRELQQEPGPAAPPDQRRGRGADADDVLARQRPPVAERHRTGADPRRSRRRDRGRANCRARARDRPRKAASSFPADSPPCRFVTRANFSSASIC